jgi:hypothetical protein
LSQKSAAGATEVLIGLASNWTYFTRRLSGIGLVESQSTLLHEPVFARVSTQTLEALGVVGPHIESTELVIYARDTSESSIERGRFHGVFPRHSLQISRRHPCSVSLDELDEIPLAIFH